MISLYTADNDDAFQSVKVFAFLHINFLPFKVEMKCFFIAECERTPKIWKIAVYSFLISLLVPEL